MDLQVVVLDGTIGTDIILSVTTNDGTAMGRQNHALSVHLKKSAYLFIRHQ